MLPVVGTVIKKKVYLFVLTALLFTRLFILSKMIRSEGTRGVYGDGTEQSSCLNLGGGHEDRG